MLYQSFVRELLTFLEKREERLLSWGFYNVRWTVADIEAAFETEASTSLREAWDAFADRGRTIRSVLQQMQQRSLLYAVPGTTDAYRTRFAEGVRLVANLRQMFKEADWATGPRLVSDIKLNIAPRQYPRRDQIAISVWERLRPHCPSQHVELIKRCFFALASRDGVPLKFSGFQVRAFEHILGRYGAPGFSGSMVCAGTGSGKTKAFYIPAFLRIVPELADKPFTKIIAIYPRNVLLADQLREAIGEADKLRPVLEAAGLRAIRFGALLGDTPYQGWFDATEPRPYHWPRRGAGTVIPYLKSPSDGGRADLIWRDKDRHAGRTCLFREGELEPDVPSGALALTREELSASPPDVLFLSLEMLNREMGNPEWQGAFGMCRGPSRSPRLLLLDEVHAHHGLTGAQVAWVLRRWRHWSRISSLHVTGLSATLQDAPQHLARLAGLPPAQVQEFRPRPGLMGEGEMEAEGAEYHMAVKGDPAAGASLLATSIQAGMLLTRLLTPRQLGSSDPHAELRPEEFFRRKVFGFSDNLDSVNRWFSDMVDAENRRLPALRMPPPHGTPEPIRRRRVQEGQVWDLPLRLGHNLNSPLTISRCSSQDRGTDPNSDLIIATSSLEVGFDDPDVGAVLHHKRPGSMSSFIQRKGRAGRTRGARPWTVVVLSDYGADRWTFHSAERLFQPEVDSLALPILNPYVVRVQLAHYLIDWIGHRIGGAESAFQCLQGPSSIAPVRQMQAQVRAVLQELLEQGQTWQEFQEELFQFFRRGSGLSDEVARQHVDALLWHEPRPLLTRVVPTLLRKLEACWKYAYPPTGATFEDAGARRPLPQFIPKTTFSELEVGEAVLEFEAFRNRVRESETVPVARLIQEACPGRVSKRFATIQGEPGYWHPCSNSLTAGDNIASAAALFPRHTFLEAVGDVSVVQPNAAQVIHRPNSLSDSSNASWQWQTLARVQGEGEALPVGGALPWCDVFGESRAYVHSNAEWVEMLRYAEECRFDVRCQGESTSGTLRLQSNASDGSVKREAVGFRIRVDGVRFVLRPEHLTSRATVPGPTLDRFRADYFAHRLMGSSTLRDIVNQFQAEWLAQMSLAMLTATAMRQRCDLAEAQQALAGKRPEAAGRVLDVIFQMRGVNLGGAEEEARLRTTLIALWRNPAVHDEIVRLEALLWIRLDAEFDYWIQQRYAASLAQAIRTAMVSMAPQVSEENLDVDVLRRDDHGYDLLVTERSPGGLGQIEMIVRETQRLPRRFLDAVEHALSYCPREQGTTDLLAVIKVAATEARTGGDLAAAFEQVRAAAGFSEMENAKDQMQTALQSLGFVAVRGLMVSVMNKVLRPASSPESDRLIFRLNRVWRRRSARLGIAVPLRTFAYTCVHHPKTRPFLQDFFRRLGGEPPTLLQLYSQIQQLLFDTCSDSCPECLDQRGRFYDLGRPSRALARTWLGLEIETLRLESYPSDWQHRAKEILRRRGRVRLAAGPTQRSALVDALPNFVVAEIDLEELRVPTVVSRIEQTAGRLSVVLHIPDFTYGQS